uniref:uncharacterized protein LOC120338405 isoform X2 n=1 Tax=Styela clava TaxID=7725 RepID=UPI0019396D07|nr:uncharacterized protein LOC120338405 isoform X2 [Styela clava]
MHLAQLFFVFATCMPIINVLGSGEFEIDVTGVYNDNIDMLNITFKETLKSPPADNMLTALTGRTMQVCSYYCRWNAKKNKYYKKCSRMSKKGFCKFCRKTICNSGAIIS